MKKKASNFKLLPSQKIKILHTHKVAPVFNFYRALHFFVRMPFATVSMLGRSIQLSQDKRDSQNMQQLYGEFLNTIR